MAIVRAIATNPGVIVLEGTVSALNLSIQAQILDLQFDLQALPDVSGSLIAQDLGVIHHMSDRVLVMQDGQVVEQGTRGGVFYSPRHADRQRLLALPPCLE